MNEELKQNDEIEIDLLELFYVLVRKWWLILLGALVGGISMLLITAVFITPKYEAQSMMYIVSQNTNGTTMSDLQFGNAITEDYVVIAKSKPVLDGAIAMIRQEEGKKFTREEILGALEVSNIADTRIIVFKAIHENPEDACSIVNAVAQMTATQMSAIMKTDPPTVVEDVEVGKDPVSPSIVKNTLLGAVGVVFIICAVLVIAHLLDDTIKTEEEITKYLGAPTLAVIPLVGDKDRKEDRARIEKMKKGKRVKAGR